MRRAFVRFAGRKVDHVVLLRWVNGLWNIFIQTGFVGDGDVFGWDSMTLHKILNLFFRRLRDR